MGFLVGFVLGVLAIAYNPELGTVVVDFSNEITAHVKNIEIN
jgi:hypothetical protein